MLENRVRDLERAVAMLIAGMSENEPEHFWLVDTDLPLRFTFTRRPDDGGLDVSFEPV